MARVKIEKVAAYIRVSTDEQAQEDKYGLDAQRADINKYCNENGLEVVKWYEDAGFSGASLKRPAIDELLEEVKNPPFSAVIIAKVDRLARSIKYYYYYRTMLDINGVGLISVSEDFHFDDEDEGGNDKDTLEMFSVFMADRERKRIRERLMGGRAIKSSKGGYSGGAAPLGYDPINGKLEINQAQAALVRHIFDLKENKGYTFEQLVDTLNSEGFKTRRGKKFHKSALQTIIGNRKTYEGYYRYGENGEWVKGEQEAILTEKDNQDGKCD